METILTILILIALSIQVFPVAIGNDVKNGLNTVINAIILIASQLLFLYLGYLVGNRFLHLLENYKGTVIFMGFFLIGIRMLMEVFKVRRGERTYYLDETKTILLASVAQGVNTFLAGVILTYVTLSIGEMSLVLLISTFIFTVIGSLIKADKQTYMLSALLVFLSAIVMIFSAVYLGFFI